jgi:hypothetical protein
MLIKMVYRSKSCLGPGMGLSRPPDRNQSSRETATEFQGWQHRPRCHWSPESCAKSSYEDGGRANEGVQGMGHHGRLGEGLEDYGQDI